MATEINGQKIFDARPHRGVGWGLFHSVENLMWHQPGRALSPAVALAVIDVSCYLRRRMSDSRHFSMSPTTPKIALGGSGHASNTWLLGSSQVSTTNGILIRSAVLQGSRMWPTNRQTDRQTDIPRYYVCSNRPLSQTITMMRVNDNAVL